MTVQELAQKYFDQMNKNERKDEELKDLIQKVYGEHCSDWTYQEIWDSLAEIAEASDDSLDDTYKEPDVYDHELLEWLQDDPSHIADVDDAIRDMRGNYGLAEAIGFAQVKIKEAIYFEVLEFLRGQLETF